MNHLFKNSVLTLAMATLLSACGGGGGGGSSSGGGDTTGAPSILTKAYSAMSTSICPSGGIQIDAGIDDNKNGVLDAAEVDSTQYVCNGAEALVSITTEPAGTNCQNGGNKVNVGSDTDGDGILDTAEITSSDYICDGATGPAGPGVTWIDATGTDVQAESNKGYLANSASQVTVTLPSSPAVGDIVQVSGVGTGGWKIAQNTLQFVNTTNIGGVGALWTARDVWGSSVASSADGSKLVAVVDRGQIYTSVNSGAIWQARDTNRYWSSVASSSDGTKLVAVVDGSQLGYGGYIYTSADSGVNWIARATDANRRWKSVASSADGSKLVAVVYGGQIYTSTNYGVNWTARAWNLNWQSVASSSDGRTMVAAEYGGQIYISTDYGANWDPYGPSTTLLSVALSSDGTKIFAVDGAKILTSLNTGWSWIENDGYSKSIASSSDGSKLVATGQSNYIYTSTDSGVTWTTRAARIEGGFSGIDGRTIATSSDGTKLVAVSYSGQIFTSVARTTTGAAGSISGDQYETISLQYIGGGEFIVLSHEGDLSIK